MDSSGHPATSGSQSTPPAPDADDETVDTPPRGERTRPKDRTSVEITLKFRFTPPRDNDNIHPAILHAHWIHEVINLFGDAVQFFDNRNRHVRKIDPIRLNIEEHIRQQFHLQRTAIQFRRSLLHRTDKIIQKAPVISFTESAHR